MKSFMYLLAPGSEARVSSDAPLDIELALAVAGQVDGARRDVDVHEVVDNPALDVVQHPVHQIALTHIHDFNVGEIPESRADTVCDGTETEPVCRFNTTYTCIYL